MIPLLIYCIVVLSVPILRRLWHKLHTTCHRSHYSAEDPPASCRRNEATPHFDSIRNFVPARWSWSLDGQTNPTRPRRSNVPPAVPNPISFGTSTSVCPTSGVTFAPTGREFDAPIASTGGVANGGGVSAISGSTLELNFPSTEKLTSSTCCLDAQRPRLMFLLRGCIFAHICITVALAIAILMASSEGRWGGYVGFWFLFVDSMNLAFVNRWPRVAVWAFSFAALGLPMGLFFFDRHDSHSFRAVHLYGVMSWGFLCVILQYSVASLENSATREDFGYARPGSGGVGGGQLSPLGLSGSALEAMARPGTFSALNACLNANTIHIDGRASPLTVLPESHSNVILLKQPHRCGCGCVSLQNVLDGVNINSILWTLCVLALSIVSMVRATSEDPFQWQDGICAIYVFLPLNVALWLVLPCSALRPGGHRTPSLLGNEDALRQRLELEAAVARTRTSAEQRSSQDKIDGLAMLAHEVRTPLNALLSCCSLLSDSAMTEEQSQYVQMITTCGAQISNNIDFVLESSRLEEGKVVLEKKPFCLPTVCRDCLHIVKHMADRKQVELRFFCSSTESIPFLGDASRLKQALLNLLTNSIKFTERGSVTLAVFILPHRVLEFPATSLTSPTRLAPPSPFLPIASVRIEIIDTGIGMTPDEQAKLFQPYMQASNSTYSKFGGSGLGLVISRQLIQLMGGTVRIDPSRTQLNVGTTFVVSLDLPLAPLPESFPMTSFSPTYAQLNNNRSSTGSVPPGAPPGVFPLSPTTFEPETGSARGSMSLQGLGMFSPVSSSLPVIGLGNCNFPTSSSIVHSPVDGGDDFPRPSNSSLPPNTFATSVSGTVLISDPCHMTGAPGMTAAVSPTATNSDPSMANSTFGSPNPTRPAPRTPTSATKPAASATAASSLFGRSEEDAVPFGSTSLGPTNSLTISVGNSSGSGSGNFAGNGSGGTNGATGERSLSGDNLKSLLRPSIMAQLANFQVMVVEDSAMNNMVMTRILKTIGFVSVLSAANGKEALDLFAANPNVHLILSDVHMPDMDGPDLAQKIRSLVAQRPARDSPSSHPISSGSGDLPLPAPAGNVTSPSWPPRRNSPSAVNATAGSFSVVGPAVRGQGNSNGSNNGSSPLVKPTYPFQQNQQPQRWPIIIALSGAADDETFERCFKAGMDSFLMKPVTRGRLTKLAIRWLLNPSPQEAQS